MTASLPTHPFTYTRLHTPRSCDGGRLYFDGCACIVVNGEMVQQGRQFALEDVEVVSATVDLQSVVSARCAFMSMQGMARGPSVLWLKDDFCRVCLMI